MPKYLLITSENIHIPGDARSRNNPGHGYPAEDRSIPILKWFDTEESLMNYLDSWGKDIVDPVIYELGKRITVKKVTKLELTRS